MRPGHFALRAGGLAAITALALGCNNVVGIEDVSLVKCPDSKSFPSIVSSAATTTLAHDPDSKQLMAPLLTFALSDTTNLFVGLYNDAGRDVTTPMLYQLTDDDALDETCGICVSMEIEAAAGTDTVVRKYQAFGEGQLNLTRSDSTGLAGTMQKLRLRHVDPADGMTMEINDGCEIAIDMITFDMPFTSAVATTPRRRRAVR